MKTPKVGELRVVGSGFDCFVEQYETAQKRMEDEDGWETIASFGRRSDALLFIKAKRGEK